MKTIVLSTVTAVLVFSVGCARGEATLTEREGKYLRFNGASDLGKLNFDRILSQWNRSNVEDVGRPTSMYTSGELETTTVPQEEHNVNVSSKDLLSVLMERSFDFKKCIFGQKKRILENPSERKNIIFKCFKVEVIKGLRGLMSESDSISLLNGYIVLEAVDKPGGKQKKHSKGYKKTVMKDKDQKTYSEYYQNIVDELFHDKESTREFKGDNTEAIFSGYGRYLINEIVENLGEEEDEMRNLKDSFMDDDFLAVLGDMSRKFVLRLNLFRGVSAIMKRSQSTGVTFDLELDDLTGFGYDDDDDDKKPKKKKKGSLKGSKDEESSEEYEDDDDDDDDDEDAEEEDEEEEEDGDEDNRDAIIDQEEDEEQPEREKGKGKGKGKGKQKGSGKGKNKIKKKKMKMLKKMAPYLLIPLMIQAAMLPLAFKFLLAFAIKALIAGKIALILVAINLIKNASFKSDEDEYIERVGHEHYGYGKGEEYGAWVNKRAFDSDNEDWTTENHPYRAYTAAEEKE